MIVSRSRSSDPTDSTGSTIDPDDDRYEIRPFESGDGEGFLSLYGAVWGRRPSDEWFEWRYVDNPYFPETPVTVAECDGEIVGARALAAFRMAVGESTATAFHPAKPLIHPDHRGRGLRGRIARRSTEYYLDREPAFLFAFPAGGDRREARALGYREAGTVPKYYRIQNPNVYVGDKLTALPGPIESAFTAVSPVLARGYLSILDRRSPDGGGFAVERHSETPSSILAELYERAVPPSIHAARDGAFYDWRFANPDETYVTYVASREGDPIAAVVVADHAADDLAKAELMELVPMRPTAHRDGGVAAILREVVEDYRSVDLITAVGSIFPDDVMAAFGLRRDDRFPLSAVSSEMSLAVYPLTEPDDEVAWTIGSFDPTDGRSWRVSYCECATW